MSRLLSMSFVLILILAIHPAGFSQDISETPVIEPVDRIPISPPQELNAFDAPNDNGSCIELEWKLAAEDDGKGKIVSGYSIQRSATASGPFVNLTKTPFGVSAVRDSLEIALPQEKIGDAPKSDEPAKSVEILKRNVDYYYRVGTIGIDGTIAWSATVGPVKAVSQWIHSGKIPVLIATVLYFALVIYFIELARRRGSTMYVRPIAGMSEIDNAIGRATEMGRPILYVLGLGAPEEIATIASYTILARVAKKTAEYRTDLIVPCNEPIVMTIAQETVKNAYMEAGHPDAYSDNMVFFVTSMQFAYVAAVNGLMLREKTATNCYFGKFYAESLLLSEAGNIAKSIQVAGTDEVAQLPFFVTTCDYTLIGEELYAASAYLGRDPLLLGALKAQDFAKALVMLIIFFGAILISFGYDFLQKLITVNL